MSTVSVIRAVLSSLHTHAWNPLAAQKEHSGAYINSGGLYINWERLINWALIDPIIDVNDPLGVSTNQLNQGFVEINNHDPQVCLLYLLAVSSYKIAVPTDTSFDLPNASGYMGISQFVDHISNQNASYPFGDFKPQLGATNYGGYSNPKGWIYWALLQIYLNLQNSPLLTAQQISNLQQSALYAAWTYYNSWYQVNGGTGNIYDSSTGTYACSQSMLCATALLDACQRWPAQIVTGMFYLASGATQSTTLWNAAANATINTVINNGAYNNTYKLWYALMTVNLSGGADTPTNTQGKVEQNAEVSEGLVRAYELLLGSNPTLANQCLSLASATIQTAYALIWDATYGGYYFGYDLAGGGLINTYKETRSTALMLRAVHRYNHNSLSFASLEAAIISVLCSGFYQAQGETGYLYRLLPNMGIFVNGYSSLNTTLNGGVSAGGTSIVVTSAAWYNGGAAQTTTLVLEPGVTGKEEEIIALITGSGSPFVANNSISLLAGTTLKYSHSNGAVVGSIPPYSVAGYAYKNSETQYTAEAMGSVIADLLLTLTPIQDIIYMRLDKRVGLIM